MELFIVKKKLPIVIILFLLSTLPSCKNGVVGEYVGIDEAGSDEIILNLNTDNSFEMKLFEDGNYTGKPQKTLVGIWKEEGDRLELITANNKIVYEQTVEKWTIAEKSFSLQVYKFKNCEHDFFASNFNLTKSKNANKNH